MLHGLYVPVGDLPHAALGVLPRRGGVVYPRRVGAGLLHHRVHLPERLQPLLPQHGRLVQFEQRLLRLGALPVGALLRQLGRDLVVEQPVLHRLHVPVGHVPCAGGVLPRRGRRLHGRGCGACLLRLLPLVRSDRLGSLLLPIDRRRVHHEPRLLRLAALPLWDM